MIREPFTVSYKQLVPSQLERCPSGLRSTTGNRVSAERWNAGSNPALSVFNICDIISNRN